MPTAEFTAKFINPPKPGKKNTSIKTETDDFYLVAPEITSQFSQGGRYKVEYRTSTFQGTTYKYVDKVEKIQDAPPPGRNAPAARYQDDIVVAERIFVCGQLNNLAANPNIDPRGLTVDELVTQTNKLREVWRRTFGNPQQSADIQDEIPY